MTQDGHLIASELTPDRHLTADCHRAATRRHHRAARPETTPSEVSEAISPGSDSCEFRRTISVVSDPRPQNTPNTATGADRAAQQCPPRSEPGRSATRPRTRRSDSSQCERGTLYVYRSGWWVGGIDCQEEGLRLRRRVGSPISPIDAVSSY